MTSYRLTSGGLVDRSRPVKFTFDGTAFSGFAGDTLASALLANDQLLVGRSFKYHRPRGILTAGAAEPNALLTIGDGGRREPNTRATVAELYDGLEATSQNCWPTLKYDIGALNGLLSPVLGAGFYYKTFMWPKAFWEKVYEPFIRRAAGLGSLSTEADPDRYEKAWAHCDLLVIGSGPAGLAAALKAARSGARVILADEGFRFGGSLLSETATLDGAPASDFADRTVSELESLSNVTLMPRTTVFGWYDDMVFGAVEKVQKHVARPSAEQPVERLWRIIAKAAILASGAEERPLVFGGNDRPGIMMASAAKTYVQRFGVSPGKRVVVYANGDAGLATARLLKAAGVEVPAVIDSRVGQSSADQHVISGAKIISTSGRQRLSSVIVERSGLETEIACDALAMSGGFSPVIHLLCQRGAKPVWSDEKACFLAPVTEQRFQPAGSAAGLADLAACLADGIAKAETLLGLIGITPAPIEGPSVDKAPSYGFEPVYYVGSARQKAFIDFQNDVHIKDLALAQREAFSSAELNKRYTTGGMATDQGKLSNVNMTAIMAAMRGESPSMVGTTTFRPFYTPVALGTIAGTARGEHGRPVRRSPLHGFCEKHGAVFTEAGLWYRPSFFPRGGETNWRDACRREVLATRASAGLCDVSTLGKIEVFGPDAAEFLNRLYSNPMAKLPVGKARYGLMLREDGIVYDDGTVSRLGDQHFFLTTTTAYAAQVLANMEFAAQTLWPTLDVRFVSVSDAWAQMSIAGPKARAILEQIVEDDISNEAFPPLSARAVTLKGGLQARLFRISFSGELAYELSVPANFGEAVADRLMEAGKEHNLTLYGLEALNVMRIEKGFITHAEIDGNTTADDLGLGKMMSVQKPDFIGKRLSTRFGLTAADRLQLVGLKPVDPADEILPGSHLLREGAEPSLANDQGYVTSSAFSPVLEHPIALALLKAGRERIGEKILVFDKLRSEEFLAEVVSPVFVDPENRKSIA